MKEEYKKLLSDFSNSIISKNYEEAYAFFSAGLQQSISLENFQEAMENHFSEINEEWDIPNKHEGPKSFELDENSTMKFISFKNKEHNYSLFSSSETIPDDITEENYEQWVVVSFLVSEEQSEYLEFDGWFDFWCIIIKRNEKYEIGYFEIHELD